MAETIGHRINLGDWIYSSMGDTMIEMIIGIIALFVSVIVSKIGMVSTTPKTGNVNGKGNEPKKTDKAHYRMRILDYLNGLTNQMYIHANGWVTYQKMIVNIEWAKIELVVVKAHLKAYKLQCKLNNWTLAIDVCPNTASSPVAKLNDMIVILTDMALTDDEKLANAKADLLAKIELAQKELDAMG
jgi:hypothetical protein